MIGATGREAGSGTKACNSWAMGRGSVRSAALFQWAADHDLAVPHLERYWTSLEERGLAASTIDRRLSTACGFYRFAHIDGRISSNPAQYVRRPTVRHRRGGASTAASWAGCCSLPSASITLMLGWPCCWA